MFPMLITAVLLCVPCAAIAYIQTPEKLALSFQATDGQSSPPQTADMHSLSLECPICLMEMREGDRLIIKPHNEIHIFHLGCITEMVRIDALPQKGTVPCPLCRTNIFFELTKLTFETIQRFEQMAIKGIAITEEGENRMVATFKLPEKESVYYAEISEFNNTIKAHQEKNSEYHTTPTEQASPYPEVKNPPVTIHLVELPKYIASEALSALIRKVLTLDQKDATCISFEFSHGISPEICLEVAHKLVISLPRTMSLWLTVSILLKPNQGRDIPSNIFCTLVKHLVRTPALPYVLNMRSTMSESELDALLVPDLFEEDMNALLQAVRVKSTDNSAQMDQDMALPVDVSPVRA